MEQVNLNSLFAELLISFRSLLTIRKQTKEEFLKDVRETYDISNPKTALFYAACKRSKFNTIRLNMTRTQILFNH